MFADANQLARDIVPFVMPPERVDLLHAAENYMLLKGGGGMTPWKRRKTPYMVEPMQCMTKRIYSSVIFMGPARTGKTEALLKAQVAHAVKCDPSDIMIVHMNEKESNYFSKVEIEPMLKATKDLRARLSPIARDNNVNLIKLKAGNVLNMAWPVDSTWRGKSFKYILLTDYDAIRPPGEGDVFLLSRMRTKSYQSSGMVLAESSPGREVSDRAWRQKHPHEAPPAPGIASLYMAGDRRRFYWQCPECGDHFIPEFELLMFDREETDPVKAMADVYMTCPCCAAAQIREVEKNRLNIGGTWLKWGQSIDQNRIITGEGLSSDSASFWLPGPVAGFSKWGPDFVQKYIKAKNLIRLTNDDRGMQAFMNTDCGWPYVREREDEIEVEILEENQSDLDLGIVPADGEFLLASVDVQGGKHRRFVCQVHSFSNGKKQQVVDRFEITQVNGKAIKPHLDHTHWFELTKRILEWWYPVEGGGYMQPIMMAFDTNGEAGVTDRAYEYYKKSPKRFRARMFPISGDSDKQKELVTKFKPAEANNKTVKGRKRGTVPLFILNHNKIKDIVTANMQVPAGLPLSMMYSHELEPEFYSELMAEERNSSGKWIHTGGSNEAFDLCVYVWAILVFKKWVNQEKFTNPVFARFRREELPEESQTEPGDELPAKATPAPKPAAKRRPAGRRRSAPRRRRGN